MCEFANAGCKIIEMVVYVLRKGEIVDKSQIHNVC